MISVCFCCFLLCNENWGAVVEASRINKHVVATSWRGLPSLSAEMKNNFHIVEYISYEFSENMALVFHSPQKIEWRFPFFWTHEILKLRHCGMPKLKTWFVFLIEFWFIGRVVLAEGKRRLWLNSTTMRWTSVRSSQRIFCSDSLMFLLKQQKSTTGEFFCVLVIAIRWFALSKSCHFVLQFRVSLMIHGASARKRVVLRQMKFPHDCVTASVLLCFSTQK